MKTIKLLTFLTLILGKTVFASSPLVGTYSFQLYFGDSKPYTDELTLTEAADGKLSGSMHVPNDFDAKLEGIIKEKINGGTKLTFSVDLPEKYHQTFGIKLFYSIQFLHPDPMTVDYKEQFIGFVTHYRDCMRPTYVGSVVGFKKKN